MARCKILSRGEKLTRFAPSPTGFLHLGHAYAASQAFGFGPCLLRIEDIDHTRCRPEYRKAIFEDLAWLGFSWPDNKKQPVRLQSAHMDDFAYPLESLRARGLLYRCFKTRKQLLKTRKQPEIYRGGPDEKEDEKLSRGLPFAWRLSVEKAQDYLKNRPLYFEETGLDQGRKCVDYAALSDEILARKDIKTSYHIACCHDDALQNITHIVRGADISPLTPFQVLLQNLMGWPTPIYHHHALLKNTDGDKLAKRNHDTAIRALRDKGFTASQVLAMAHP